MLDRFIPDDNDNKAMNTDVRHINVSNHAMERYAERILSKKDKCDIKRYVASNTDKIMEDIGKMIRYGSLIYTGKNPRKDRFGGTTKLSIYSKDTWIILVNPDNNSVITLFKKDLELDDEELNKKYVERLLKKFLQAQMGIIKAEEEVEEQNKELRLTISENDEKIAKYRTYIKQLEEANSGCKAMIEANHIKVREAEEEFNIVLEKLVTR